MEKKDCLLIIDDNKGRKEAKQLGLTFTGTLGILIRAKD
jgi:predicted nucleic acid-binding protein